MVNSVRKISVIIPTLNEAGRIASLLYELQPLRERGHEIIVVDGGSRDGTKSCARPLADIVIGSERGRAKQLNTGATAATGEVLWFLHADSSVPEDADNIILNALSGTQASWGRFDVRLSGSNFMFRVIERMMNLRSCLSGIATGDQGLFVERNVFEELGGYPDISLMEDVRLSRSLKRYSWPACLHARLLTSSRRWEQHGIVRTVWLMWWLRLAHFFGASPSRLAEWYGYKQYDRNNVAVLVFARAPVPGQVKTRLIPALGEQGSAELHKRMVRQTLDTVTAIARVDVQLWCTPDANHPFFTELANRHVLQLRTQHGDDLGQRMQAAFEAALAEYKHVVLIGTDCPGLGRDDILQALQALRDGQDVVLGPAEDGGYVLIGLSQSNASLFTEIDWGTSSVLMQTRARVKQAGLRWHELPSRHDLDTPADLARFPELSPE